MSKRDQNRIASSGSKLAQRSAELERILIASILQVPDILPEVAQKVTPEMMFSPEGKAFIAAAMQLRQDGKQINMPNISAISPVSSQDVMELVQTAEWTPDAGLIADKLAVAYRRRVELTYSWQVVNAAGMDDDDATEALIKAEKEKAEALRHAEVSDSLSNEEKYQIWLKGLEERIRAYETGEKKLPGYSTGLGALDEATGGYMGGHVWVFGARPGVGKTQFMIDQSFKVSAQGCKVGVLSPEMSYGQLMNRFAAHSCHIDSKKVRDGRLSKKELELIKERRSMVREKILIEETLSEWSMMKNKIASWVFDDGVKMVFIDYLQLLTYGSFARQGKRIEIGSIARDMKDVAKKFDITLFMLSQLVRLKGRKPTMDDLREAGDIEAGADNILLGSPGVDMGVVHVEAAKVRDGDTGDHEFARNPATGRWGDIDDTELGFSTEGRKGDDWLVRQANKNTDEDVPF